MKNSTSLTANVKLLLDLYISILFVVILTLTLTFLRVNAQLYSTKLYIAIYNIIYYDHAIYACRSIIIYVCTQLSIISIHEIFLCKSKSSFSDIVEFSCLCYSGEHYVNKMPYIVRFRLVPIMLA